MTVVSSRLLSSLPPPPPLSLPRYRPHDVRGGDLAPYNDCCNRIPVPPHPWAATKPPTPSKLTPSPSPLPASPDELDCTTTAAATVGVTEQPSPLVVVRIDVADVGGAQSEAVSQQLLNVWSATRETVDSLLSAAPVVQSSIVVATGCLAAYRVWRLYYSLSRRLESLTGLATDSVRATTATLRSLQSLSSRAADATGEVVQTARQRGVSAAVAQWDLRGTARNWAQRAAGSATRLVVKSATEKGALLTSRAKALQQHFRDQWKR
jgi:hypothetical protein